MLLNAVRYIPFSPNTPYENMAIDEYLISYARTAGKPVLRLYGWSPPGISIGRFQDAAKDINLKECEKGKVPVVRRITGGGAIFHADELTYCLVFPENFLGVKAGVKESFEKLNYFLIKMYSKFGLEAGFSKHVNRGVTPATRAAFCFSANEEYDIIIKDKKIGGNAQARKKGIIFQHGSIPLRETPTGVEKYFTSAFDRSVFTDLSTLLGRQVMREEAEADFIAAFTEVSGVDLSPVPLEMEEKKSIVNLLVTKYINYKWNNEGKGFEDNL